MNKQFIKQKTLVFALLLLFLGVGFNRSILTIQIKWSLYQLFSHPLLLKTHQQASTWYEILICWADTALYSLLHSALLWGIVAAYFRNKNFNFYTLLLLCGLFVFSVIFLLLHRYTKVVLFHRFSEDLLYVVLSPTPLLFLCAVFGLYPLLQKKV